MFYNELKGTLPHIGMKVCGAGGGGVFLVLHQEGERERVLETVVKMGMTTLDFSIEKPR